MSADFIFTVTAGRSGQNTLTRLLANHVPNCYPAFEEPKAMSRLPSVLGDLERRFRRNFIQTHELLGRGKVLTAYQDNDVDYLNSIAKKRLRMAEKTLASSGAHIYIDVSKFFARGLHVGFANSIHDMGLIRLVRDPIANMRSFLNRNKNFYLDNSSPDGPRNLLRLDPAEFEKGELYLWAWCEMYLRFDQMVESLETTRAVEIRTEDLNDADKIDAAFKALGLEYEPVKVGIHLNSNKSKGLSETSVSEADIETYERFYNRLSAEYKRRIPYLESYDPRAVHTLG